MKKVWAPASSQVRTRGGAGNDGPDAYCLQTNATGTVHDGDVTDYAQGATIGKVATRIIFNKSGIAPRPPAKGWPRPPVIESALLLC
jgi:hypothetical protein